MRTMRKRLTRTMRRPRVKMRRTQMTPSVVRKVQTADNSREETG